MGKPNELGPVEGPAQDEVPEYAEILRRAADAPRKFPIPRTVSRKHLEQAFLTSFELIGGVPRLALWADTNPGAFYSLCSKLFPQHVESKFKADESLAAILSTMGRPASAVVIENGEVEDAQIIPPLKTLENQDAHQRENQAGGDFGSAEQGAVRAVSESR